MITCLVFEPPIITSEQGQAWHGYDAQSQALYHKSEENFPRSDPDFPVRNAFAVMNFAARHGLPRFNASFSRVGPAIGYSEHAMPEVPRMLSSTVSPPACPTPAETIAAAIDRVVPLQGLPFEDRLWLAHHSEEIVGQPGDILFEEGAPADRMILILKGEIHVRRNRGGPMELFIGRAGQMTGLLPFSRMKVSGGQGFAVSPVWALLIPKSVFPEMLAAIPSMTQRVVSTLLDRVREVTRIEQQAEKLSRSGQAGGQPRARAEQSRICRAALRSGPGDGASSQPAKPIQVGQPLPDRGADSVH